MVFSLREKIAQIVDGMTDEIVDLTCQSIRFPTIAATGASYPECVDFLSEKLGEAGLAVERIEIPREYLERFWGKNLEKTREYIKVKEWGPPKVIAFGKWAGTVGKPSLHLNCNYGISDPKGNPFEPTVKEGKIFGKGASDPRAGTVSQIMAVKALRKAGATLKGNLFVSQTPDNHLGGESCVGFLVDKGYGKSSMVINGMQCGADTVILGHKGALWLKITTFGEWAHPGEPVRINAIDKMMKIHNAIRELDQKFVKKKIKTKWPMWATGISRPSFDVCAIKAEGLAVPDKCVMYADRRLNPEETMKSVKEEILGEIRKLKRADKDLKAEVEFIHSVESSFTPPDSLLAKTLMRNIRQTMGVRPKAVVMAGYKNSRFFTRKWKAQTVIYSPGLPGVHRGRGEYVPIQDLVSATKVLALTIMDLLG